MGLAERIDSTGIAWSDYPFAGATVYPSGRVTWAGIRDVDPETRPPEVRTKAGETLLVHAEQRGELAQHAAAAGVPTVRRADVWGLLLDPFLDTYFDPPQIARTNARLESLGISNRRRERIHARFGAMMRSYNLDSGLWEWGCLGLMDFLGAVNGNLVKDPRLVPPPARRPRLYRWAMTIAERGRSARRTWDTEWSAQ